MLKSSHIISQNISWLGDKNWALMAIMIILLTTSVGQPIILYIAAMGNIDNSLVEAARVDGATEFQVFWKIKWPSLLPTTLLYRNHYNNQLIPVFRFDSAFDFRWSKLLNKYTYVLPI